MSTVQNLDVALRLKEKGFGKGLKKAEGVVGAFAGVVSGKLGGMGSSVQSNLLKLGAATLAAAASWGAMKAQVEDTSALVDLGNRIGADVSEIQKLDHIGKLAGMSSEEMHGNMEALTRSASQAAMGLKKPAAALQELGINAQEFNKMSLQDKMHALADAMEKIPNPGDKLRLLKQLRLDPKLLNSLEGGSAMMKELEAQAEKFGQTLSQKNASEIESFGDKLDLLEMSVGGFAKQLTAVLSPAFGYLSEVAANAFNDLREYMFGDQKSIEEWGSFLKAILQSSGSLWEMFKDTTALTLVGLYEDIVHIFKRIGDVFSGLAEGIFATLTNIGTNIGEFIGVLISDPMAALNGEFQFKGLTDGWDSAWKKMSDDTPRKISDLEETLGEDLARHTKDFEKEFGAHYAANLADKPENKPSSLPNGANAPDKKSSGSASLNLSEFGSSEAFETIAKAGNARVSIEQKQLDVLDDIEEEVASLNTTIAGWGVA